MSEFWIDHASAHPWVNAEEWETFFYEAESILGSRLTHLDTADPVRQRVMSLKKAGEYASQFDEKSISTWIFGRFGDAGVEFSVQTHSVLNKIPNFLTIYTTEGEFDDSRDGIEKVKALFKIGSKIFRPFYSYGDDRNYVRSRKPKGRSVDINAELIGVCWMTYFGEAYVNFFGKEKFLHFPHFEFDENGGVTVELSRLPETVPPNLRAQLAAALGSESFVDPGSIARKPQGRFALTLKEIIDFDARMRPGLQ